MARKNFWKVPALYKQKAHRLLKNISEHADILTRKKNKEAVIYGNAISGSNFKSLFKLMVSNQPNVNLVGIEKFVQA